MKLTYSTRCNGSAPTDSAGKIKRGIVAKDDEDEKRVSRKREDRKRLKEVSSSSLDLCEL